MPPDGILILDKPAGITSRQAVARVATLAGGVKAGHAGTLDPLATGVLVVCLGRGTLLAAYLAGGTKEYRVEALLGVETDTYDTDGKVVSTRDAYGVTGGALEDAVSELRGTTKQVPPPYSAVKVNGKPLYRYARRGEEVAAKERAVRVDSIELTDLSDGPRGRVATIDIRCGPGTYVRSLVHDLGERLGCGACVSSLVRVRSGPYALEDAVTLHELERELGEAIAARLVTLEEATADMPTLALSGEQALAVTMGKPIEEGSAEPPCSGVFRIVDGSGALLALYGPPRGEDEGLSARAVRVVRPHNEAKSHEAA